VISDIKVIVPAPPLGYFIYDFEYNFLPARKTCLRVWLSAFRNEDRIYCADEDDCAGTLTPWCFVFDSKSKSAPAVRQEGPQRRLHTCRKEGGCAAKRRCRHMHPHSLVFCF
jgi:hypothetical protein